MEGRSCRSSRRSRRARGSQPTPPDVRPLAPTSNCATSNCCTAKCSARASSVSGPAEHKAARSRGGDSTDMSAHRRIAYRAGVARRRRLAQLSGATVRTHLLWLALIAGVACYLYSALFSRDPLTTHEGLDLYFRTHEYLKEF